VQGQEVLKVRDFAKIGLILDASVEDRDHGFAITHIFAGG